MFEINREQLGENQEAGIGQLGKDLQDMEFGIFKKAAGPLMNVK